jgi:hypothetical protein
MKNGSSVKRLPEQPVRYPQRRFIRTEKGLGQNAQDKRASRLRPTLADARFGWRSAFRVNFWVFTRSEQFTAFIAPYICTVSRTVESVTTHT